MGDKVPSRSRFAAVLVLALGIAWGWGRSVGCDLPPSLTSAAGEEFLVDPHCETEAGRAYEYQWNPGDGRGDLPWSESSPLRVGYGSPGFYPLVLKVRVDGIWNPANTYSTTVQIIGALTPARPSHSSTLAYDPVRHVVWNVNRDQGTVTAVDARAGARIGETKVGDKPRCLALDGQGNVWVTVRSPASLVKVDASTGSVTAVGLPRGSLPFGVVIDTARGFAYVSLEGTGRIAKVDLAHSAVVAQASVFPTPRALALDHRGERLFAARFHTEVRYLLPPDSSRAELAELSAADLAVVRVIPLAYDRSADSRLGGGGVLTQIRSLVIHPDGKKAWVAAVKANVFRGRARNGTDFDPNGENTLRSVIAVVDLESGTEDASRRLDIDDSGMPSAIAFTREGSRAFLATEGTNSVELLDAATLMDLGTVGPAPSGPEMAPDGLVLSPDDSLLFVHNFTTRSLGIYDRTRTGPQGGLLSLETVPLVSGEALTPQQLLGLQIFHNSADPRITKSGYISCAACHPDGGSDRLVWDFTQRGEGLRRTIPLNGRAGTAHGPIHWSANFDEIQDFEHDIRGPFAGTGLMDDAVFSQGTRNTTLGDGKSGHSPDLDALAAYVSSLAVFDASPFRNQDGSFTADALAGSEIFRRGDVGCAVCHSGTAFTDSDLRNRPFRLHDVGTLTPLSGRRMKDTLAGLDTPTLLGIWQYPPYLHDGSAPTLMDVLTTRNPGDKHGRTSQLSELERSRLVEYLLQLGPSSPDPIAARPPVPPSGASPLRFARVADGLEIRFVHPSGPSRLSIRILGLNGALVTEAVARRQSEGYRVLIRRDGMPEGSTAGKVLVCRVFDGVAPVMAGKFFLPR